MYHTDAQAERLPGETKTAARKRRKAARKGNGVARAARIAEQCLKDQYLHRCCSEAWFWDKAAHRPYIPSAQCRCRRCLDARHFGWPNNHYIGSGEISYDCWLERNRIDEATPDPKLMSERDARRAGLTIKRHRQRDPVPTPVLVPGCEGCEDGLRPRGDRFCVVCAARVKMEMRESGYL